MAIDKQQLLWFDYGRSLIPTAICCVREDWRNQPAEDRWRHSPLLSFSCWANAILALSEFPPTAPYWRGTGTAHASRVRPRLPSNSTVCTNFQIHARKDFGHLYCALAGTKIDHIRVCRLLLICFCHICVEEWRSRSLYELYNYKPISNLNI